MVQHPPCDAPMESPDSALFEGIGSSVPQLYHRKELTNVHAKLIQFPPEMDENWLRYELFN